MALDIVGAGFGRTGTLSMKLALEMLGFNKTYHMAELFQNPGHLDHWEEARRTGDCDWDTVFREYRAAVDWPACNYWRTLSKHYPESKVILTVRDPDDWFRSIHSTIYPASLAGLNSDDPFQKRWSKWGNGLIWEDTFHGRVEEKEHAIEVFNANTREVIETIAAGRLLVYESGDGWESLCDFLDCEIPQQAYPKVNTTKEFQGRRSSS
ncbi:MAG: sulfotransferase [Pseudomonadales bacterium]|jgi:hypothetical protein|nr:sulfotransferase [Pseudomonadales bacterium]MDP7360269.1 sulfotransferase [Pseudomonadales bacterium]MDP7597223.1 sulfotransferase [Pseudomonadales bacterium]HJN52399.1 sulfotransferase [Pseudomonadales bacterium]|tara:strand:- start:655 stop:1281 length:627 start_codon:yes stop_codon:yes gene_type:complete